MTKEEFDKLIPGQEVEAKIKGAWVLVTFECRREDNTARVRRIGKRRDGNSFVPTNRPPNELRVPAASLYPRAIPNVFADWLDDYGYSDAADALRGHFPFLEEDDIQ